MRIKFKCKITNLNKGKFLFGWTEDVDLPDLDTYLHEVVVEFTDPEPAIGQIWDVFDNDSNPCEVVAVHKEWLWMQDLTSHFYAPFTLKRNSPSLKFLANSVQEYNELHAERLA